MSSHWESKSYEGHDDNEEVVDIDHEELYSTHENIRNDFDLYDDQYDDDDDFNSFGEYYPEGDMDFFDQDDQDDNIS